METAPRDIVYCIDQYWEEGIVLSSETLFFLDSTFGISTAKDLSETLAQEDFSENELILEMLLYPDLKMRSSLEPFIPPAGLKPHHLISIRQTLGAKYPEINYRFPKESLPVRVRISSEQIELFVSRLFLDRALDPDICQALEEATTESDMLSCRILLRQNHRLLKESKKQFLIYFIQQAKGRKTDFPELFEISYSILSQVPESNQLALYFLKQREKEKSILKDIKKFEEKLDQYNMEYLMMSRYPVPQHSIEESRERLRKLDIIINDILCIIPPPEPVPIVQDFGRLDPKKELQRILRSLS